MLNSAESSPSLLLWQNGEFSRGIWTSTAWVQASTQPQTTAGVCRPTATYHRCQYVLGGQCRAARSFW